MIIEYVEYVDCSKCNHEQYFNDSRKGKAAGKEWDDQHNYNLVSRINARLTPLDVGLKLMPPQGEKRELLMPVLLWCPRVQSLGPTQAHKSISVRNSLNYTSGGEGAGWTAFNCFVNHLSGFMKT